MDIATALDLAKTYHQRVVKPFEKLLEVLDAASAADVLVREAQATVDRLAAEATTLRAQLAADRAAMTEELAALRATTEEAKAGLRADLAKTRTASEAKQNALARRGAEAQAAYEEQCATYTVDRRAMEQALTELRGKLDTAREELASFRARLG